MLLWWTKLRWPVPSIDGSLRHAEQHRNRAELGPPSDRLKPCVLKKTQVPWFCELSNCADGPSAVTEM